MPYQRNRGMECNADECHEPAVVKGMCKRHYGRMCRNGHLKRVVNPTWFKPRQNIPPRGCSVEGCDQRHKRHGFCDFHADRKLRYGTPLGGPPKRQARSGIECSVPECNKPSAGGCAGYCGAHYYRVRRYGDPRAGGPLHRESGRDRWHVSTGGYVWRYCPNSPDAGPNGFVYQHREVMAERLGRPLSQQESVHHKNGVRSDNRPENLELWSKAQPAGQRVSDLVSWAKEILSLYGAADP
jgi:hypothetical protein